MIHFNKKKLQLTLKQFIFVMIDFLMIVSVNLFSVAIIDQCKSNIKIMLHSLWLCVIRIHMPTRVS